MFLITTIGRSGSKWLAWLMNQSPTWTVLHEPHFGEPMGTDKDIQRIRARFGQEYYGECNPPLIDVATRLRIATGGVLLRDLRQVVLSQVNRVPGGVTDGKFRAFMAALPRRLEICESLITAMDYMPIDFRTLVSDTAYAGVVLRHFGIEDVQVTPALLAEKKNNPIAVAGKRSGWLTVKCERFEDLPAEVVERTLRIAAAHPRQADLMERTDAEHN